MAQPTHPVVIGLYPGSFDPPTLGHIDIACRAARLVERLVVAVYARPAKNVLFTPEERVTLWQASLAAHDAPTNIDIRTYDELTTTFAQKMGATAIIRGLRTVNDFETETCRISSSVPRW
jgi:pantetheine-phosphate adenylyltransferase